MSIVHLLSPEKLLLGSMLWLLVIGSVQAEQSSDGKRIAVALPKPAVTPKVMPVASFGPLPAEKLKSSSLVRPELSRSNVSTPLDPSGDYNARLNEVIKSADNLVRGGLRGAGDFITWCGRSLRQFAAHPIITPLGSPYPAARPKGPLQPLPELEEDDPHKLFVLRDGRLKTVVGR